MVSRRHVPPVLTLFAVLILIGACATVPEEQDWIEVGRTTKDEVIKRYGEPDLVIASSEGEIATYRARNANQAPPRVEIPTAQMGPFGMPTTKMEPVDTGPGSASGGSQNMPAHELQLRYDARGIVQEIIR